MLGGYPITQVLLAKDLERTRELLTMTSSASEILADNEEAIFFQCGKGTSP